MVYFSKLFDDKQWFIVLVVFLIAFVIQLFYYLFIYIRFAFHKKKSGPSVRDPVSVIICARNEAENLENYLPVWLTQDYPEYEVIVVNDCSTDDTDLVINKYMEQYPRLRTSLIKEDKKFAHGKKLAVTIGIKAAKYDRLLFTDADCKPESNQWISRMSSNFSDQVEIVLGYGGYFNQPGILNKYIRYDTLVIALQYFSYALFRRPYMGVGRNLAYKRSIFFAGQGFKSHFHLASGDDDLFVNENATKTNTAIEYSCESHTRTAPKETYAKWFFQKKRHFTTNKLYKPGHKVLLTLEPLSRFLFYAGFIGLLIIPVYRPLVLSLFAFRLITQLVVIKKAMIRLNEKNLLLISLPFDLFSLFINLILIMTSRIRPSNYQWK
ncbi:MAG: glycosyltransferase [Bacteroidales bacterium]|nr:glycosyltransferase [Bacteroidales bacterium]